MAKGVYFGQEQEYTRIEYIESTGTQWIDTGFSANNNTRVQCEFEFTAAPSNWWTVFNCRDAYHSKEFSLMAGASSWYSGFGSADNRPSTPTVAANTRYVVDKNKNVIKVNNVSTTQSNASFTATATLHIFSSETGGSGYSKGKLYSFKLYDNGTVVRNFIPVLDSQNVACFYDVVNGAYYYSGSNDAFVGGPVVGGGDIAKKVSKIYYGVKTKVTPVEYIQAQGSQYIISDYSPTSDTKVEMQVKFNDTTRQEALFIARDYTGNAQTNQFNVFKLANGQFRADFGATAGTAFAHSVNDTDTYTYVLDSTGFYEDETLLYASTAATFQTTAPLYFFTSYSNGAGVNIGNFGTFTLFYCKIYENDVLVREYIPALIDDTEYGLYETVRGRVLYNVWHGSFLGGNATGDSFYIERARKVTRAYVGVNDVAELSYVKETLPAGAVHLFHLDNTKYDALGHFVDTSGTQQQVTTTGNFASRAGWGNCIQVTSISSTYCKAPTHEQIIKNANTEWTLHFWANNTFDFYYGNNAIPRIIELKTQTSSLYIKISTGSGSYYSGQERAGATADATASISISANEWHHYAFVVTKSKMFYAFLDGVKVISKDISTPGGSYSAWGECGGGRALTKVSSSAYMDEIAIFNKALWADDFTPPQAPYDT